MGFEAVQGVSPPTWRPSTPPPRYHPPGVFPRVAHRRVPYLCSQEDVARLLEAAAELALPLREPGPQVPA